MIIKNSFYIETYGCAFNQSDSQKIKYLLIENGYKPTDIDSAEFIIVNTCGVKSQTEAKILFRIKKIALKDAQKLIIAGCLPWISKTLHKTIESSNSNIIGILKPNDLGKILKLIKINPNLQNLTLDKSNLNIYKENIKPWIEASYKPGIVQIAEGCNGKCTYCSTKNARGELHSFSIDSIISQIGYYINEGINQIYLTAQDVGSYSFDNYKLIDLLKLIDKNFQKHENVVIRLGMLNPEYLIKNIQKILNVLEKKIYFNFIHIPIQSASDKILKLMKRKYNSSHIFEIFNTIRSNSNFTVSTDIICGFPEESGKDHQLTLEFIEQFKPDILNISKFTARLNTEAKHMKPIDSKIVKARTEQLTKVYKTYMMDKNKNFFKWRGKVLITEYRVTKKYPYFGRNIMYKPVILKQGELNKSFNVEIIDTNFNYLIGKIIK